MNNTMVEKAQTWRRHIEIVPDHTGGLNMSLKRGVGEEDELFIA